MNVWQCIVATHSQMTRAFDFGFELLKYWFNSAIRTVMRCKKDWNWTRNLLFRTDTLDAVAGTIQLWYRDACIAWM